MPWKYVDTSGKNKDFEGERTFHTLKPGRYANDTKGWTKKIQVRGITRFGLALTVDGTP
jgi:hypothetical protein